MHEDWEPDYESTAALDKAVTAWNESNANAGTYWEDRKRKWSRADMEKDRTMGVPQ